MDITISVISIIISAVAVIVTVVFNWVSHIQYLKSIEPQLSFRLTDYEGILCLSVKNTGKLAATDLKITINELHDNGANN